MSAEIAETTETTGSALAAALSAFQAEIPSIAKGKTGDAGSYSYQYAGLDDIVPVAMPLLARHGLSFVARPTMMGGAFVLDYALMHFGGESLEGIYPLPDPLTTKPQTLGGAITYARRYAFCAVTGIAPGGDDDDAAEANGTTAAAAVPKAAAKPRASEPPRGAGRGSRPKAKAEAVAPAVADPGWAPQIADALDGAALRDVKDAAEESGVLGKVFAPEDRTVLVATAEFHGLDAPPVDVTVMQMLNAVNGAMRKAATAEVRAADETAVLEAAEPADTDSGEWPTIDIPKDEN